MMGVLTTFLSFPREGYEFATNSHLRILLSSETPMIREIVECHRPFVTVLSTSDVGGQKWIPEILAVSR